MIVTADRETLLSISFPVVRIRQPIGDFFVAKIEARPLYEITWVDIRRIGGERPFESYLGIQRPLDEKRAEEIRQYVHTIDATFPTGIIVAVSEVCARMAYNTLSDGSLSDSVGTMTLSNYQEPEDPKDRILFGNIAKVLDGQHRIAALKDYTGTTFELNVTIFVGIDVPDQAAIFSTVNKTQTRVNKSLVYDLFALSKSRSPERTCHEITVALDSTEGSPFYKRIKRLGVATEGRFGETLSQANVVDMLLRYISTNPELDRDDLKRGRRLPLANSQEVQRLIFRNMFIQERDAEIANVVWNYFEAVVKRWPSAWSAGGRGMMLNKTNGFRGLMRFLRPAYLHLGSPGDVVSVEDFLRLLRTVKLDDTSFTVDKFKPGSTGETELYRTLVQDTGVDIS